jgi:hypothetical protein
VARLTDYDHNVRKRPFWDAPVKTFEWIVPHSYRVPARAQKIGPVTSPSSQLDRKPSNQNQAGRLKRHSGVPIQLGLRYSMGMELIFEVRDAEEESGPLCQDHFLAAISCGAAGLI